MGVTCCCTLQRGAVIIAIIDLVLNGILFVLSALTLIAAILVNPADSEDEITQREKVLIIVISLISLTVSLCQILLALYLKRAANENDSRKCKRWLMITLTLFVIAIITLSIDLATTSQGLYYLLSSILGLAYKVYAMYVVVCLVKEINRTITVGF